MLRAFVIDLEMFSCFRGAIILFILVSSVPSFLLLSFFVLDTYFFFYVQYTVFFLRF